MNEKDHKETSKSDDSAVDDNLENLSPDEKAAFEKIMAQIESADEDSQADASEGNPIAQTPTDANLSDSEQPALDTITAEINEDTDKAPETDDAPDLQPDDVQQELSEDQQAALDKIMAEINEDTVKAPETDDAPDPQSDDAQQELSEDQQAALDKIMAEIGEDTDKAPETDDAPDPQSDDAQQELSEDQQAALDKIMAEIGEDTNKAPETDDAPDPQSDDAQQELSEDQQAALDKIMAEIKPGEHDAASHDQPSDEPAEEREPEPSLSIDEFNDELTNLLSSHSKTDQVQKTIPTAPSPPASEDMETPPSGSFTADTDTPTASNTDEMPSSKAAAKPKYTMLQEVVSTEPGQQTSIKSTAKQVVGDPRRARSLGKKSVLLALLLVVFTGSAYFGLQWWKSEKTPESGLTGRPLVEPHSTPSMQETAINIADNKNLPPLKELRTLNRTPSESTPDNHSPNALLASLAAELDAAQLRLNEKKQKIKELIDYYQNGILEEQQKIQSEIASVGTKDLSQALKNNQIGLSLKAIQRRMVYQAKLRTPLEQLEAMSEEFLYLERKRRMLAILSKGISGLSVQGYQQEVAAATERQIKQSANLSVDQIDVQTPSFEIIWKEVLKHFDSESTKPGVKTQASETDQQISQEICNANFDRKAFLSSLDPHTAVCLSKWQGKDLYLNNVTQLTPETAKALAQWPGEWLSLNGIRDLSPESAQYIAMWPGKRLSLNGLSSLSHQTTVQLSKWKGEQLEMIGLKSIGGWENYSTRLYLSETLQRKLQLK